MKTVVPQAQTIVQNIINTNITADLAEFGTHLQLPAFTIPLVFDYSLLSAPVVNAQYIGAALNATFYDADNDQPAPFTPQAITDRDASGKDFQFFMTDYVADTLLYAAYTSQ